MAKQTAFAFFPLISETNFENYFCSYLSFLTISKIYLMIWNMMIWKCDKYAKTNESGQILFHGTVLFFLKYIMEIFKLLMHLLKNFYIKISHVS